MTTGQTDNPTLFANTVRKLLASRTDAGTTNHCDTDDFGWSKPLWDAFAEIGVLGLTISERHDGVGAGPFEAIAVMTELGRGLAPAPVVECALLPAQLISDLASSEQCTWLLPLVAAGTNLVVFAHLEVGGDWTAPNIATRAVHMGDHIELTGAKTFVLHGDRADFLIVSAFMPGSETDLSLFVVDAEADGVRRDNCGSWDGRRGARITLAGARAEQLEDADSGARCDFNEAVQRALIMGQLAICAEAVGAMDESLRMTVEYLNTRTQFGSKLGSFQALAHRASDMYVAVETARALTTYATAEFARGNNDPIPATRAKLQVGRSARHIAQEAIQLHGGVGMTAEHAIGRYARRLLAIEHTFGSTDEQLRLLAAHVRTYNFIEL